MKIREEVEKLEQSSQFKRWKKENKDSFLADAFMVIDTKQDQNLQLGYYTKGSDRVTVFKILETVEISQPEEIFKKEEDKIHEVVISDVAIEMDEAFKKSVEFSRVKYPKETAVKTILILQNTKEVLMWNITHITSTYNAINIRVDAINGNIISHTIIPLFEFTKKD